MKIQFSLFKVFVLLTACAVCLSIVAEVGPWPLVTIPALAVVAVGMLSSAAVIARLLLLLIDCVQRYCAGETSTDFPRSDIAQADRGLGRHVDTVVVTADRLVSSKSDSSIMFLGPNVSDSDVASLCEFSELKWLLLDNTEVSDAGLLLLSKLTKLRRLYVRGTRVTPAGIQRLQSILPYVKILH